MCVCVSVCVPLRLAITSGVMWHDMDPIQLVKEVVQLCMAAIVSIVSRCGLTIEACHRKQPNKSKLEL